jgi:multidrug efflux pump subunit AcrA (membrane-fusion protein)
MPMRNRLLTKPRNDATVCGFPCAHRLLLSFMGGCVFFFAGCSREPAEKEPIVTVQAVTVQKTTLQHTVSSEAILFPLQQAAIIPKINAPVKTFYVKRGGKVHKGQLLAELENRDLAAAAEDTRGAYQQAQATYEISTAASLPEEIQKATLDLQAAKQTLDAEQTVYQSREELFKQGALPRKELDASRVSFIQARNQFEIAQKHLDSLLAIGKQQELKSAAGQLQSAKGKLLGAEAQLSYSEIHSPIDGVVTDRPLYPGEMASSSAPLITVMDISQVIAKAHITQSEAELLKVGDEATLTVPGVDDPVPGKVTIVSPALDPNSTTVEVWVQAANPRHNLLPGTSVKLSMLARTVPDALVIPASALLTGADVATTVMVAGNDNRVHQRAAKVGIRQDDQVQITQGVQAGDRVISSGAYGLPDNTRIKLEATGESPTSAKPGAARTATEKSADKSDEK